MFVLVVSKYQYALYSRVRRYTKVMGFFGSSRVIAVHAYIESSSVMYIIHYLIQYSIHDTMKDHRVLVRLAPLYRESRGGGLRRGGLDLAGLPVINQDVPHADALVLDVIPPGEAQLLRVSEPGVRRVPAGNHDRSDRVSPY